MRRWVLAFMALLALTAAFVDVTIVNPRVNVRWRGDLSAADRMALEERYQLRAGEQLEGTTWRYELPDRSRENVRGLVNEPAAADTGDIDRPNFAAPEREIRVTFDRARVLVGSTPSQLVQLQSLLLLIVGLTALWGAGAEDHRRRRVVGRGALLAVVVLAYAFPLQQPIRMGDSETYVRTRESFTEYSGVQHLRFEAHLSHAILGMLDGAFGRTPDAPRQALDALMHGATLWFVLSALALCVVENWSAVVLRYLGLALLAPSALLYFGYRELGHLSLNVAAFPLIARGLQSRTRHLEAGAVLSGLGTALHGFGLLSLAGAGLAALGVQTRVSARVRLAMRIMAWGATAYLGWLVIYLLVLRLPLVAGHASSIPLRPWFVDVVAARVNPAIFSTAGGLDVFFSAWAVGAPLLVVAGMLWRVRRDETRAALLYAIPSVLFLVMFWPIQGVGVEMDLVFAAFPATYALAWVCAHDSRSTNIAAVLLASAHLAFWRVALGLDFVNSPL